MQSLYGSPGLYQICTYASNHLISGSKISSGGSMDTSEFLKIKISRESSWIVAQAAIELSESVVKGVTLFGFPARYHVDLFKMALPFASS
jgi:hypothetical protein